MGIVITSLVFAVAITIIILILWMKRGIQHCEHNSLLLCYSNLIIAKEKAVYITANQAYGLHSIGPSHGHTATTVQGETGPVYEEVEKS